MANAIDPYSYGMGLEHGTALIRVDEVALAHSLAILEESFRQVETGRKSAVEYYFESRVVFGLDRRT